MLHRPDLGGSSDGEPIIDDYYFYLTVGELLQCNLLSSAVNPFASESKVNKND